MKWRVYVVIGLVALIIFGVIMHFVNRKFRINYNHSLYAGGFGMLIAIGGGVGFWLIRENNSKIAYIALAIGVISLLITAIITFKKCGWAGIPAMILQTVCCVACIFFIFDMAQNRGYSNYGYNGREERIIREKREELKRKNGGYDPRNNYDPTYYPYDPTQRRDNSNRPYDPKDKRRR